MCHATVRSNGRFAFQDRRDAPLGATVDQGWRRQTFRYAPSLKPDQILDGLRLTRLIAWANGPSSVRCTGGRETVSEHRVYVKGRAGQDTVILLGREFRRWTSSDAPASWPNA